MDYDLARVFYLHLILHSEIGSVPIYSEMSIESSELLQLINMFQMSLNPANFLLCQVGLAAYPWVPSSKTRTLWGYQHNLVELNQKKVNKKKGKEELPPVNLLARRPQKHLLWCPGSTAACRTIWWKRSSFASRGMIPHASSASPSSASFYN